MGDTSWIRIGTAARLAGTMMIDVAATLSTLDE